MKLLIAILVFCSPEGVLSFVGYSVSQSSHPVPLNGPHSAVDEDITSCATTNKGVGEYWKIQFNQSLTVAGVQLRLKGGNYTIQVQNKSSVYSSQHVCSDERLPFTSLIYEQTDNCNRHLYGDVIIINQTSYGSLKVCDFKLKVCEVNTLGIPCTKCTPESTCQSCDGSHYGVWCEHECSPGCVPGSCDELGGTCQCQDGYRGSKCQITGNCSSLCENCSSLCTECDVINQNCTVCRESRFGEICQRHCPQHCEMCDINNGTCLQCETGHTDENCTEAKSRRSKGAGDIVFWVLFPTGFILLLATPFIVKRLRKRLHCFKTSFFNPTLVPSTNVAEDALLVRHPFNSSRVILEPEGNSHNLEGPYNGVVQVVVTFSNIKTKCMSIEQFVKDTHQKMTTNEFRSEFKDLPNGLMDLHTEALKREHTIKNRFKKIYPYDANRVILEPLDSLHSGNYINASYVHGVYKDNAYIAAQGPFTPQTIVDFWRMVWQTCSKRIVMLTRLKEGNVDKCLQYWPDEAGEFGPFSIIIQKEEKLDKFTTRKLIVRMGEETRRVTQFHFTVWPDTKVPQNLEAFLCFRNITKNSLHPNEGPMIIHGSAGIGRTGTFIALDYLLDKGFKEGNVDVKHCVITLRQQRAFSIQSVDQYVFLHDALVEGLTNLSLNCALHVVDEM
ncbi:uncharacterized protein LOC125670753 isoform X2 [Ostrea edulis]|uniref:uncharacterized protein LOC125670753 isoform X2 n=1 Tax=Ostrea edulis TaxID=37623 RepID=UPI0024AECBCD|nr:uncharacterized protein LOC125670753 isoform X2 [Ostrea edulis]